MAGDDFYEHDGLADASRVAYSTLSRSHSLDSSSRIPFFNLGNPFRESGPPACMAKLIMLRHKVRSVIIRCMPQWRPIDLLHPRSTKLDNENVKLVISGTLALRHASPALRLELVQRRGLDLETKLDDARALYLYT